MHTRVVETSEGRVRAERNMGRPSRLLVEYAHSADRRARVYPDSEFGDCTPGGAVSCVEDLKQPVGCLTDGIDDSSSAQAEAERCSKESIPCKRSVHDDRSLAFSLNRSEVRLPGRQIPECAGRSKISIVLVCGASLNLQPEIGASGRRDMARRGEAQRAGDDRRGMLQ